MRQIRDIRHTHKGLIAHRDTGIDIATLACPFCQTENLLVDDELQSSWYSWIYGGATPRKCIDCGRVFTKQQATGGDPNVRLMSNEMVYFGNQLPASQGPVLVPE